MSSVDDEIRLSPSNRSENGDQRIKKLVQDFFHFPEDCVPYPGQVSLMASLYACLTLPERISSLSPPPGERIPRIFIAQSPTGTGKSLSLLCGVLKVAHYIEQIGPFSDKSHRFEGPFPPVPEELVPFLPESLRRWKENVDNIEPESAQITLNSASIADHQCGTEAPEDWVVAHRRRQAQEERSRLRLESEQRWKKRICNVHENLQNLNSNSLFSRPGEMLPRRNSVSRSTLSPVTCFPQSNSESWDDSFLLEEKNSAPLHLSNENVHQSGETSLSSSDTELDADRPYIQVFYCSRTHSQLSQMMDTFSILPYSRPPFHMRGVTLASRAQLCVNEKARSRASGSGEHNLSVSALNDICTEMQHRSSASQKCSFLSNRDRTSLLVDRALISPLDIEEATSLGRHLEACPYYVLRHASRVAHIIFLPYSSLVHERTRSALQLSLRDSIVIIDEAHNIEDACSDARSSSLTCSQVRAALKQIQTYVERYADRLSFSNLRYSQMLLRVLDRLNDLCHQTKNTLSVRAWNVNDFLFHTGIDDVNIPELVRWMHDSGILRKLQGFIIQQSEYLVRMQKKRVKSDISIEKPDSLPSTPASSSLSLDSVHDILLEDPGLHNAFFGNPMYSVASFLESLMAPSGSCCVYVDGQSDESLVRLRVVSFDASETLSSLVCECRCLILAGGTLPPEDLLRRVLFPNISHGEVHSISCPHVIPSTNILSNVLCTGPMGQLFDFSYAHRTNVDNIRDAGLVLSNLCSIVPGGIIVFFPSFQLESDVMNMWQESSILENISKRKVVFREPRSSHLVEKVLQEFSSSIQGDISCDSLSYADSCSLKTKDCFRGTGALLTCIMNGKMSEGLNFADDLARCVVIFGMPYPNKQDPLIIQRLDYVTTQFGADVAEEVYETMCFKAVNQSVGRAFRHRNDHAAIIFLDHRYSRPSVRARLPSWIETETVVCGHYGDLHRRVADFFRQFLPKPSTL